MPNRVVHPRQPDPPEEERPGYAPTVYEHPMRDVLARRASVPYHLTEPVQED